MLIPRFGLGTPSSLATLGLFWAAANRAALLMQFPEWAGEDALITIRHVQNLLMSGELVYNLGERVQGTSSPLYALLLTAIGWVPGDTVLHAGMLNLAFDLAALVLVYRLCCAHNLSWCGAGLVWVLGSYYPTVLASAARMETSLYLLLMLAAILCFDQGKYRSLAILLGLLLATRLDGAILVIVLLALCAMQSRRLLVQCLIYTAAVGLPWYVFAMYYYGSPLPHTAVAKSIAYANLHPLGTNLLRLIRDLTLGAFGHRLLLLPFVAYAGWLSVTRERWLLPVTAFGGAYLLAYGTSRTMLFQWYLVPLFVVHVFLAAVGAARLVHLQLWRREHRLARLVDSPALIRGAVVSIVVLVSFAFAWVAWRTYASTRDSLADNQLVGEWLARNTEATCVVFAEPLGYIGYYSGRHMVDAVGLVSPQVLPYAARSSNPDDYSNYLAAILALRPDYAVLRDTEYRGFAFSAEKAHFDQDYRLVHQQGIFGIWSRHVSDCTERQAG